MNSRQARVQPTPRRWLASCTIALLVAAAGCSDPDCAGGARKSLAVTINDASTGEPICDAFLCLTGNGKSSEIRQPWACGKISTGADPPSTTYKVEALAPGYTLQSQDVYLRFVGHCATPAKLVSLTFELQPK